MTETKEFLERDEPKFSFHRTSDGDPGQPAKNGGGGIEPTQFTRVRVASRSGYRVFGMLRSVVRGGIQVLTTVPVPARCPLEITLEGCQPAAGEAIYAIKRGSVFLVGMVFSSRQKPSCALGSVATIRDLESPRVSCRGSILDVGTTSVSVLCKTEMPPGAWVRLESSGWILFGVVQDVVPTSMLGRCVRIHLETAFQADTRNGNAMPEKHILRSFPRLQSCTGMDRERPLQGDIL